MKIEGFTISELGVIVKICEHIELQSSADIHDYEFQFTYNVTNDDAINWIGGFKDDGETNSDFVNKSRATFIIKADLATITCGMKGSEDANKT